MSCKNHTCGDEKKPEHAREGRSEKAAGEVEKNQSMPEKADRRRQQGKLKKIRACRRRQIGEGSRGS
jgi:hypothetical protein